VVSAAIACPMITQPEAATRASVVLAPPHIPRSTAELSGEAGVKNL
jgi:hypothetical protein